MQRCHLELLHVTVEQTVGDGSDHRRGRREKHRVGAKARRVTAVIRRLVGEQALADRDPGARAGRHVDERDVAAAPEDAALRDEVVVARGVEVLQRPAVSDRPTTEAPPAPPATASTGSPS